MTADGIMTNPGERMKAAFAQSVVFHLALVGGLTAWALLNPMIHFGGDTSSSSATPVEVITIPLPSRGPENPVANDTKSIVPQEVPEKPAPKARTPEPEDAEPIASPVTKAPPKPLTPRNALPSLKQLDNQITSKSPQAASSPLLQPQAGLGNVGSTIDAVMGDKFAAYASEIKRLTTASWKPQAVNSDVAPPARISFTLHRDGHVSNVRLVRRSGIAALDLSVQEAVEDARYPPLPPDFDKDTVQVEFTFEYRP